MSARFGLFLATLLLSAGLGLLLATLLLAARFGLLLATLLLTARLGLFLAALLLAALLLAGTLLLGRLALGTLFLLGAGLGLGLTFLSLLTLRARGLGLVGAAARIERSVGPVQGLFRLRDGTLFQLRQGLLQAVHLLGGFWIGQFQVVQIFQEPFDLARKAVGRVVQAVAHLALNLLGILQLLPGRVAQLGLFAGLVQRPLGFVHRAVGLALHGQNAFGFFANLAPLVFHLAGGFLRRDHPQPHLAALAEVRAVGVLEVDGFHRQRDHRARGQAHRGQVPALADLVLAHHRLTRHGLPERANDRLAGLFRPVRKLIPQPDFRDAEVVFQVYLQRNHRLGRHFAIGRRVFQHDTRGRVRHDLLIETALVL